MTKERKKFQDELIKRENEEKNTNSDVYNNDTGVNKNVNKSSDQRYKKSRKEDKIYENFIHEDTNAINNDILYNSKLYILLELKRKNEKLKESGIRIKWRKNTDFSYNNDTIYEYFIEYGPILEVKLDLEKHEAYILYETSLSIVM